MRVGGQGLCRDFCSGGNGERSKDPLNVPATDNGTSGRTWARSGRRGWGVRALDSEG